MNNLSQVQVLVEQPAVLGEGVVTAHGYVYWVDITPGVLYRLKIGTDAAAEQWQFAEPVSAVAPCENPDEVLVALRQTVCRFNMRTGVTTELAAADFDTSVMRFNDGRCDPAGRFWVGTYHSDRKYEGAFYCLDVDGVLKKRITGIAGGNGLAWSPDGATMYFADTTAKIVYACDYDVSSGAVGDRRVFLDLAITAERPDGAAVDAEGCYWVAMYGGGRIVRFAPDGARLQTIDLPTDTPTKLAFGGTDLKTLYITSASQQHTTEQLAQYPQSGCLFTVASSVAGLPEPLAAIEAQ